MDTVEKHQQQLLEQSRHVFARTPISEATAQAYLATPRHRFVRRYREWGIKEWREVRPENLAEHAATLYANMPLILFGEDDDDIPSTISQPAFVLRMLDLLQLQPGQKVFELGAGSGWNAALMGHLVGPDGRVCSAEIIPEVAKAAAENCAAMKLDNVRVVAGDGGEGYATDGPYDRAIFTAGTYDLPRSFYTQIKEGGLLLVVIKSEGGGDNLFLLRKVNDHFESTESMPCSFVQLRGRYQVDSLEPKPVEALGEWAELQHKEVGRMRFWWGWKGSGRFPWCTFGIRAFLGITEPAFRAFKTKKTGDHSQEEQYFGLWEKENGSLVLAKDDWLIAHGNLSAKEHLVQRVRQWVDLGMPSAASFNLQVYPSDVAVMTGEHQWVVSRSESQFVWSLEA